MIMKEVNIYRPELDYSANESYKSLRTNLLFCGEEKRLLQLQVVRQMKEKVLFP